LDLFVVYLTTPFSGSDYVASNEGVTNEWWGRKRLWPTFKVLSYNLHGGTEENHENVSQDNRSPGQDLNPGSPEYEAGVIATRPQRSVI
jgi:hypothetical protein